MSRKTVIICDLCGREIVNKMDAHGYEIKHEKWSPIFGDFDTELIDAHKSCVISLLQAKREKQKEMPNA